VSFAVLAELPLGVYRGLASDSSLDPFPTPARLHAALLCAAAAGPRAVADGDLLGPNDDDLGALAWMEGHPPDGVVLPRRRELRTTTVAFRVEGTLRKEGPGAMGPRDKVTSRAFVGLVAVDGAFGWTWDTPPPEPVRASLEALVSDVSHLGTSETPARLRLAEAQPTHRRQPGADLFTGSGLDIDVAAPGRAEALRRTYREQNAQRPAAARDRYASSEEPLRTAPATTARVQARYVADAPVDQPAPWRVAHLAVLDARPPRREDAVSWAVAAHRALCARLGDAPPLLTGVYAEGARRPANRVALHVLHGPTAAAVDLPGDKATLVALVPSDADPVEAAAVAAVMGGLDQVTLRGRRVRVISTEVRSAATFWPTPTDGAQRRWVSLVPVIPDVRPPRRSEWTLADAVTLALALVVRDELRVPGRGAARYLALRDAAVEAGAVVHAAQRVVSGQLTRYVHHVSPGTLVQPLDVELETGTLLPPVALMAIGQSRHLGGGLLIPTGLLADRQ